MVRQVSEPDVVLVASGSEVALAVEAAGLLERDRLVASVVSVPWRERFFALDDDERRAIVAPGVPVLVVEAGSRQGWEWLAAPAGGDLVCLERFGMSGRGVELQAALGFSVEAVAARAVAVAQP